MWSVHGEEGHQAGARGRLAWASGASVVCSSGLAKQARDVQTQGLASMGPSDWGHTGGALGEWM